MESALDDAGLDLLVETVHRLSTEFPSISTGDVTATVLECRRDLSAVPPAAEPELVERLARVRLEVLRATTGL